MEKDEAATRLNVRGVKPDLWRRVRAEAVRRGLPAGELLNQIFKDWLDRQVTK